ncbi:MAG TPA: hypothetical protein VFI24_01015 [Pyrinomonadaceae bacterium]|nr:hypothetical protein [Pyrinomonadaceae bacterium]
MNQESQSRELAGEEVAFSTTTGYATGATCLASGTFRASNKYMDVVLVYAAGETFLAGPDGQKTTWYALSPSLTTNKGGGFESVKVAAGAA